MNLFPWLFCLVLLAVQNPLGQSESVKSGAIIKFAFPLYEEVKKSQPTNFVLSPFSLRNALATLSLGAAGETATEIRDSIKALKNVTNWMNKQSKLLASLKKISSPNFGVEFVTADKIYANSELSVKAQFQMDVEQLGGEVETVDFGNSEAAARQINSWAQNKTAGKIQKIVDSGDLSSQTSLLVLNTIYFKGLWKNPFFKSSTLREPFFMDQKNCVMVDMMMQENEFRFADLEEPDARVILLPYKKQRLSMMIYVPNGNAPNSLSRLESWLKNQSPFEIQNKRLTRREKVSVFLPKFKIRSSLQLNAPLKNLGLGKMFDSATADFSGIFNGSERFFVSKVSQETFIEVNEEEMEAAAVTGLDLIGLVATPDFTVNGPFLFQIVDRATKTVLFMGRVTDPRDF